MSESASSRESLSEILAAPRPQAALRKRVLVTGASGMLGMEIAPVLAGAGLEVFARPRSDLDVTDELRVDRAFRQVRPEIVVNCAAFTKVDACETDPRAFEVNATAVERLARQCVRHGAQLVHISTDFVFDGSKLSPYLEDDPTSPLSAYGRSKLAGEEAALTVPTALVVRSSWVFGPHGWNFVEAILKQIEEGKRRLTVVADQRGRPTCASDLAGAVVALLQAGGAGLYHFANQGEVSWLEFARAIVELAGREGVEVAPTDSARLGRPARRPAYSVLDTTRFERATGLTIRHFRVALSEYLLRRELPQA